MIKYRVPFTENQVIELPDLPPNQIYVTKLYGSTPIIMDRKEYLDQITEDGKSKFLPPDIYRKLGQKHMVMTP